MFFLSGIAILAAISATTRLRVAIYFNSAERIKHALEWSSQTPREIPRYKPRNPSGNTKVHGPPHSSKHINHAERRARHDIPRKAPKAKPTVERRRNAPRKVLKGKTTTKSPSVDAKILIKWSQWRYQMEFAIGTPELPITAILDTGSDLVWTQCRPCPRCEQQPEPIYDPRRSSSFSQLPFASPFCRGLDHNRSVVDRCDYNYEYGFGGAWTRGVLASETFTFGGTVSVAGVAFGCGRDNVGHLSGTTGIAGLGQGRLSLVSQLKIERFSYCLTPVNSNSSSHLLLGSFAKLDGSAGRVQSTPLLNDTTMYHLSLRGMSIGATLLPIPSTVFEKEGDSVYSGTTIDSGATTTLLPKLAYDVIRQKLESFVGLPVVHNTALDLDLCFRVPTWPPPKLPDITFHFHGANMTTPVENYMYTDRSSGTFCFMMEPTPDNINFTNIGNFQLQNMHILHDLSGRMLSFVPAQCDKL